MITYRFINGINTLPSDDSAWTDRAEEWVNGQPGMDASKQEYWTGPLMSLRSLRNKREAENLAWWIDNVDSHSIRLVGHSNGCDIICSALEHCERTVDEIHLVAGAVEHDFAQNNLAAMINAVRVQRICIYASKGDWVLRWLARPTRFLFRRLGYGYLGYIAAVDPSQLRIPVTTKLQYQSAGQSPHGIRRVTYANEITGQEVQVIVANENGHTDWFKGDEFDRTMRRITNGGSLKGESSS